MEDTIVNQRLIKIVLENMGLEVHTADNGKLAVDAASQQSFDAILMDVQMPVMDGLTATMEIRHQGLDVPIIALTASAMQSARDRCLDAGCNGYLTKPIDAAAIAEELSKYTVVQGEDGHGQVHDSAAVGKGPSQAQEERLRWLQDQGRNLFGVLNGSPRDIAQCAEAMTNAQIAAQWPELRQGAQELLDSANETTLEQCRHRLIALVRSIIDVAAQMCFVPISNGHRPVIDMQDAMERLQLDQPGYYEILEESLSYLREQLPKLEAAIRAQDLSTTAGIAHAIGSNAGNIGMNDVLALARSIEARAEDHTTVSLKSEFEDFKVSLEGALEEGAKLLTVSGSQR